MAFAQKAQERSIIVSEERGGNYIEQLFIAFHSITLGTGEAKERIITA